MSLFGGGAWRSFFLDDIARAKIIDGPWRSDRNRVAKIGDQFRSRSLGSPPGSARIKTGATSLVILFGQERMISH